jgi:2Fe-2S ferredoxin
MPKVKSIEFNGTEHVIDANNGDSIMIAATSNLVPGIDADCGGECSCATCHVLIGEEWRAKLVPPTDSEESMLDLNPDRSDESRLSCQIPMSDELDGIVVNLPEFQY